MQRSARYHLCYIFQDERGHCWGHASSHDLVHWRRHTPALFPAPGDVDKGIFSGNCFVNKDGAATMLYHGVNAGNCIATSSDPNLDHWSKLAANPIVPNPLPDSPESKRYQSWDPHGWVEGDSYRTFCMKPGENPVVTAQDAPFTPGKSEPLHLRVFLDRSILEVFANRRQCVTQRIYPTRSDSLGVALFSEGGDVDVESLSAWDLAAANPW